MAEWIKMLFRVNTLGAQGTLCLTGGPDSPTAGRGGFDAVFTKLLWPVVNGFSQHFKYCIPAKCHFSSFRIYREMVQSLGVFY